MLRDYRYNLIRYVSDLQRMEPINVGVILQGAGRIDMRINPDTARRDDVATDEFRRWKNFLGTEVWTDSVPLFQPDRATEAYLVYLQRLCTGPVFLSKPLVLQASEHQSFDSILEMLYLRLVAPPAQKPPEEVKRPTGAFRRWSSDKKFLERGMRRHAHVVVQQHRLWMAYRQVHNGEAIALDKVEVANRLGETSNEIERLPLIADRLVEFLHGSIDGKRTRYYLLADELKEPFSGQSAEEFDLMTKDLEERVSVIRDRGGEVLRSASEVLDLVNKLDESLPPPAPKK